MKKYQNAHRAWLLENIRDEMMKNKFIGQNDWELILSDLLKYVEDLIGPGWTKDFKLLKGKIRSKVFALVGFYLSPLSP